MFGDLCGCIVVVYCLVEWNQFGYYEYGFLVDCSVGFVYVQYVGEQYVGYVGYQGQCYWQFGSQCDEDGEGEDCYCYFEFVWVLFVFGIVGDYYEVVVFGGLCQVGLDVVEYQYVVGL